MRCATLSISDITVFATHIMKIELAALLIFSTAFKGLNAVEIYEGSCGINDGVCTLNYSSELKPWIHDVYLRMVDSRRAAENHNFISSMSNGEIPKVALLNYFKGMYWHGKQPRMLRSKFPNT